MTRLSILLMLIFGAAAAYAQTSAPLNSMMPSPAPTAYPAIRLPGSIPLPSPTPTPTYVPAFGMGPPSATPTPIVR